MRIHLIGCCTLLAFGACAHIDTASTVERGIDLADYRTYAWLEPIVDSDPEADLDRRLRAAFDQTIAARGLKLVPLAEADLLAESRTRITEHTYQADPYYSVDTAKLAEMGTIEIDLRTRRAYAPAWRGSATTRLRYVGYRTPNLPMIRDQNPAPRHWPVDRMIQRLADEFPAVSP